MDDDAYELLKLWKRTTTRESFSAVVEKIVLVPGTLGAFLGFLETHQTDEMPGNDILEETLEARPVAKQDPWS